MNTIKKSINLIMALIMLLSCCTAIAFAADSYDHLPQIYVEGLDSKPIYYKDDPDKKPLFYPIDTNMIFSNLLNYKENIDLALKNSDPDLLKAYLYEWLYSCYGMTALGKDGYTMQDDVMVPETTLNYKGNGKYVFQYDTRLGPVDVAKELDEYIKWVQEDSKSDRFELAASSYGASVAIAYLNEYPETIKYIDSVVLCVPASNGITFIGELFAGNLDADPDALVAFLDKMLGNDDITILLSLFNKTGTLDSLLDDMLEPVLKAAIMDALRDILHDIFATWPSLWSFVDQDHFYDALENIYGENYADPNHEYAVHINRITYYYENIMCKNRDILTSTADKNVNVNILCKYAEAPFPLDGNKMSDTLVILEKASFGATSALHNQKLPDNYTQALYSEYNLISPDRSVDASTGLFPFNTWYIKGLSHSEKNDAYYNLINTVLYEDLDIFTRADMPQYLEVPESDSNALVPSTADEEPKKETSWLEDFLTLLPRLLRMLIDKIKGFFNK